MGLYPQITRLNFRLLGTDIDKNILRIARDARYSEEQIADVPDRFSNFFSPTSHDGHTMELDSAVRSLVTFRQLNLLDTWPMTRKFDVILCRNVMIYFDEATQKSLCARFRSALKPGGHIFLGHSERIANPEHLDLVPSGITCYKTK